MTASAPSASYVRRQNVIAAAFPFAIGVGAAVLSWNLGVGSPADPGPGMWPLIVSVAMAVIAGVLVLRPRPSGTEEAFTREGLLVVVAVASLVGYTVLFELIGFEIPTLAVLVLWTRILGRASWAMTVPVAVCTTAALYLVFITALGVSLPHIVHM